MAAKTKVIIALDCNRLDEARGIVETTREQVGIYKVGSILFTACGPKAVEMVRAQGREVFLDLKYHDIPNTVMGAVEGAAAMGVSMLTVHCAGGTEMIRAALKGASLHQTTPRHSAVNSAAGLPTGTDGVTRPRIIGVTVLTSLAGRSDTLARVLDYARDAAGAGVDGVVCSPLEVSRVKHAYGDRLLTVVPGIRLGEQGKDDQARIGTPVQAARDGADFVVVGRSVTASRDPGETLRRIQAEIGDAWR
jgi:orotidine-5'-phosphate decarboxylase